MTYKIAIFGSAVNEDEATMQKAKQIGEELGKRGCIIITGACSGIPFVASKAGHQNGAKIWGFSPYIDEQGQKGFTPDQDLSMYNKLIYVPADYPFAGDNWARKRYRNISSTATCDAGIIISGRWGSMNEFTNLVDMGKIVGILTGTGGIADELPTLNEKIKKNKVAIISEKDPKVLVEKIFQELNNK